MTDALKLTDVKRRFGKAIALDGLSLAVKRGEIYGFLGRNGAGKTTTLRILTGVLHSDAGTVEVLGQQVKKVPVELKRRIGSVSQEQHFYPWMSGRELGRFVSGFYPTWDAQEFERLCKLLDVPLDKRAMELSGGTRTKLGLALALAPRPELLLLDEPTTGLDPVARREFNDLVSAIVKERGCTAFLSSHLVDEVQQVAHRVGIIQAGKMRIEGEVPWLLDSVRRVRWPAPDAPAASMAPRAVAPDAVGSAARESAARGPAEGESAANESTGLRSSAVDSSAVGTGIVLGAPQATDIPPVPAQSPLVATLPGLAAPHVLPPGFEVVRGDVVRAPPELWQSTVWPDGTVIEALSLEDVFLAFARTDALQTAA